MLIGYVGADDAELNVTGNGTAVANFSFAVNEAHKDRNGEWVNKTTWYKVSAWGNKAKRVAEKVTRGRFLYLEGAAGVKMWKGNDGKDRADLTLRLDYIRFLDKDKEGDAEEIRTNEEPFEDQF